MHPSRQGSGKIPAIIFEGFLDAVYCDELSVRLKHRYQNSGFVRHYGPSLMSHATRKQEYFEKSETFNADLHHLFEGIPNPVDMIHDMLSEAIDKSARTATEDDKLYSACTFRVFENGQGSPVHKDIVRNEGVEYNVSHVKEQTSAVLYLSAPKKGGELVIYDRVWAADDERLRMIDFGYEQDVVHGSAERIISPRKGTLVLFNPAHYHKICPAVGSTPRETLSLFAGFLNGEILTWA